ncbi:protein translocase subunit SecF, partial [Rhodococcus aerolatus]
MAEPREPAASEAGGSFLSRLYTGTGAFDVIGRRKLFYGIVAVLMVVSIGSMVFRGFSLGIDFEGGTQLQLPAAGTTTSAVEDTYRAALGMDPVAVQTVGTGSSATVQIRSVALDTQQVTTLKQALLDRFQVVGADGQSSVDAISDSAVSETWGGEITQKALIALVVFLVLVSLFIGFRFERDMALAALAALVHDLVLTAGIYSLVGFEVTPATVIGLLTILGFSLYDTVVVFDKVQENTRGFLSLSRRTYAEQANLAVNQTLMRSINTTVIAVLPVLGLLVIGVGLLGVGTLKDLALVQLTGLLAGTYSSVFFATPLLVTLKERGGEVREHTRRVMARRAAAAAGGSPAAAAGS